MILTVHFSFSSVLVFIFGVFVGIIWGAYIYVKRKKKLIVSHIDKKFTTLDVDKQKEVNDLVNNIYLIHKTTHKGPHKFLFGFVRIKRRKNKKNDELINKISPTLSTNATLANEIKLLIEGVAKIYYPDSKYPLGELSINEVFKLLYELLDIIKLVIDDLQIPELEKVKAINIKDIITLSFKFKKFYNIKGVKLSIMIINAAIKIQSVITPIYWIKKGTKSFSIDSLSQFLVKCTFELIGKQTANVYSKTVDKIEI